MSTSATTPISGQGSTLDQPSPGIHDPADTRRVVLAAALGTVFEWYDFFIYGSLAAFFGVLFFPPGNETAAFLASLATFGAGFVLRPFGALVFGRLGDVVGRKRTFLITMLIMGLATAVVGLLPTFAQIGWWAPVILVLLRLLQGLAVGGEFGGAVTCVAEHASSGRRGFLTSWIQITATGGLLLSLLAILVCRNAMSPEAFASWGWRIPFVGSVGLLLLSLYIRLKLHESPVFKQMQSEGKTSKNPIKEVLGEKRNLKIVLIAIFGAVAGQAVIWYTGHFYSLYLMTNTLRLDASTAYVYLTIALVLGTPFFVVFGWLSDIIGRKWIIIAGCALSAFLFIPVFNGLMTYGNPRLAAFRASHAVALQGAECIAEQSVVTQLFTPAKTTPCSKAKSFLTAYAVPYTVEPGDRFTLRLGDRAFEGFDEPALKAALVEAGMPLKADPAQVNAPMMVGLLFVLVFLATMVYGPLGAMLVELFPTHIRYSGVSVALQFGNGWIGGFAPLIAASMVVSAGDVFAGLWYTVVIAAGTAIIGALLLRETSTARL